MKATVAPLPTVKTTFILSSPAKHNMKALKQSQILKDFDNI